MHLEWRIRMHANMPCQQNGTSNFKRFGVENQKGKENVKKWISGNGIGRAKISLLSQWLRLKFHLEWNSSNCTSWVREPLQGTNTSNQTQNYNCKGNVRKKNVRLTKDIMTDKQINVMKKSMWCLSKGSTQLFFLWSKPSY